MRKALASTAMLVVAPGQALAHASERAVILTLPTAPYIFGSGLAVAATAGLAGFGRRIPEFASVTLFTRPALPDCLTNWLSSLALGALIVLGLIGSHDPLRNLLPLMVWTVIWIGLPFLTLVFGNLWRDLNPWTGPVVMMRAWLKRTGGIGLSRFAAWPAVFGLFGFVWFQIISLTPEEPAHLAQVVAAYWLIIFVLAVAEGEDWLNDGECLTVFFNFMALMSPFWCIHHGRKVEVKAGWPGTQIVAAKAMSKSACAFVTLIIASLSFDGLHHTFWWLARIGVNPLDFPGRSAVIRANTVGLFIVWLAMAGLIALVLGRNSGRLALSFLPIAAGYHMAHYLVAMLTQGQYVLAAIDDFAGPDRHLLGLPDHWVSFGFLSLPDCVRLIWQAQVAIVLGAHILAVILAEKLTKNSALGAAHFMKVSLTLLMVLYTVFGLWLLATPAIG